MPLPASLIASIISAILETVTQGSASNPAQYENYAMARQLPPEAKLGVMLPPPGDGSIVIDNQLMVLSPTAQFRSQRNLIVMPMSIQNPSDIVYITDASGAIYRVWMLHPAEAAAHPNN